jgi:hypothetical protein
MYADYYRWGKLTIEKDTQNPWLWDLCLNGTPLRKGYIDPNQAAYEANHADVGDSGINSILKGNYAPSDLRVWSQSRGDVFRNNNERN